jgi:hypothetical protein
MVQQVVDLGENLQMFLDLVARSQVDYAVPGRSTRSKVIDPVGPALVVLVSAGVRTGYCDEVEIGGEFSSDLGIAKTLKRC